MTTVDSLDTILRQFAGKTFACKTYPEGNEVNLQEAKALIAQKQIEELRQFRESLPPRPQLNTKNIKSSLTKRILKLSVLNSQLKGVKDD